MAITSSAGDGIRITTAAKSGTVKSFTGGLVRLEDPITTGNNGNLEASPTYTGRFILIDGGTGAGQIRFITQEDTGVGDLNDVDIHVNEPWTTNPDGTSTYQISYGQGDVATVTGATINSKTNVLECSRELSVGTAGGGGAFAFLGFAQYEGLEVTDDTSAVQPSLIVEDNGRLQCGYTQGGVPVSGAIITGFRNADGEDFFQFNGGAIVRIYASVVRSWLNDLLWQQTSDSTNDVIVDDVLVVQVADNAEWRQGEYRRITWQGANRTADTILLHSDAVVDEVLVTQINGFTSRDDTLTELLQARNVTFAQNLQHVIVHDDKTWKFVNPIGWVGDQSFIVFQVDDLNSVERLLSIDLNVTDTAGTAISGASAQVYEGSINSNLPPDNSVVSDANGDADSDLLVNRYTFPSSVFTTTTFGSFFLKLYAYTKQAILQPLVDNITGFVLPITVVNDAAITQATQHTAIQDGAGIVITRHATGETDPRAVNVIRFTGGTDGGDGTPSVGDTITGAGGATGVVVELLGSFTGNGFLVLQTRNATAFVDAETLTDTTQTNQWTATADLTPSPGVDLDFTWLIEANGEAMTAVYDYIAAHLANRRNPITFEDDGTVFADLTAEAKSEITNNLRLLPAVPAASDALYFGSVKAGFERLRFQIDTAATIGAGAGTWEYWNGSTWAALSGVSDGTTNFTTTGLRDVTYTFPTNWATTAVNSVTAYWVRYRVTTGFTSGGSGAFVKLDPIFEELIIWGEGEHAQPVFSGGAGFFTERNVANTEGVWVANRGTGSIDHFTDDAGASFTPPVNRTYTVSGLQSSSEVRIYEDPSVDINQPGAEINGVESSGASFAHSYQFTASQNIIVHVFHLNFKPVRFQDTLGNEDRSVQVFQIADSNYNNP